MVFLRYYGKLYFSFIKNLLSPCEMLIGILLEENYVKRSFVERDFILFFKPLPLLSAPPCPPRPARPLLMRGMR